MSSSSSSSNSGAARLPLVYASLASHFISITSTVAFSLVFSLVYGWVKLDYHSGLPVSMVIVSLNSSRISSSRGLDFWTIRAAKFMVFPSFTSAVFMT